MVIIRCVYPRCQRYFTWPILGNFTDRAAREPAGPPPGWWVTNTDVIRSVTGAFSFHTGVSLLPDTHIHWYMRGILADIQSFQFLEHSA